MSARWLPYWIEGRDDRVTACACASPRPSGRTNERKLAAVGPRHELAEYVQAIWRIKLEQPWANVEQGMPIGQQPGVQMHKTAGIAGVIREGKPIADAALGASEFFHHGHGESP